MFKIINLNNIAILVKSLDFALITMDTAITVFLRAGIIQLTEYQFQKLLIKMVAIVILKMG